MIHFCFHCERKVTLTEAKAPVGEQGTNLSETDAWLATLAGIVYLSGVFWSDQLMRLLGLPSAITADYVFHHAAHQVLAFGAVRLPAIMLVTLTLARKNSRLRECFRVEPIRLIGIAVGATVVLSILLNNLDLWPFTWRWQGDPGRVYILTLEQGNQWGALILWILLGGLVTPFLEECIFRFGILRSLHHATGSSIVAVVGSSLLFGFVHLVFPLDRAHLVNAIALTIASVLLGWLTILRKGNIFLSTVIHAARNLIGLLLLVDFVS